MSTEPQPLLAKLRSATEAQHRRAESLMGLPENLPAYIENLLIFYGFVAPWESKASKTLAPLADQLQGRWKSHLIANDLGDLGVSADIIAKAPRCDHLPDFADVPTALGSMYVLEGSTLGGQIISRHVENKLGMKNGVGYSYYRSYGSDVGLMWRQFIELLTQSTTPEDANAVVRSACETFEFLCDWFEAQRVYHAT